mgnify:CR=1 FL=1
MDKETYKLPSANTMSNFCKFAIIQDKPIMMDYWVPSCDKKAFIGLRENGEKLLVKSEEEYTSPITKIYDVEEEYIVITENSIYVISKDIPKKRVS